MVSCPLNIFQMHWAKIYDNVGYNNRGLRSVVSGVVAGGGDVCGLGTYMNSLWWLIIKYAQYERLIMRRKHLTDRKGIGMRSGIDGDMLCFVCVMRKS